MTNFPPTSVVTSDMNGNPVPLIMSYSHKIYKDMFPTFGVIRKTQINIQTDRKINVPKT